MNFLTKLGQIVLKVVGIWMGFAPLIQPNAVNANANDSETKVIGEVTQVFGVITTVEQMFASAFGSGKMSSEKLAAATPFVAQLIQKTDLLIGKKPKDETMFMAGATDLTNALVKILNAYGE